MTGDPRSIFRKEALDFHGRDPGPGGVLRLSVPWVRWLYGLVLVLLGAGAALGWWVRVDESASGPAVVDARQRTFVALLPGVAGSDARRGRLRLEVDGLPGGTASVQVVSAEAADAVAARRAGFDRPPDGPAVLVGGVLPPAEPTAAEPTAADPAAEPTGTVGGSGRRAGRAVLVLGSRPVLTVLLRGVDGVLSTGEGDG